MYSKLFVAIAIASSCHVMAKHRDAIVYFQEQTPSFVAQDDPAAPTPEAPSTPTNSYYYHFPDMDHNSYGGLTYLYWTVSQAGLHYATTKSFALPGEAPAETLPSSPTAILPLGEVHQASFDWSSGGRAFLGYQIKHTPWALYAEYTYYHSSGNQTLISPGSSYGYLNGMSMYQETTIPAGSSQSDISFSYQSFHILLETTWHPLPQIVTVFGFGPKTSWFKQDWDVRFLPVTSSVGSINASLGTGTYNQMKWKAWGVGLDVAGDIDFNLGAGFSLGIGGSISPLVGQVMNSSYNTFFPVGATANGAKPIQGDFTQAYTYRLLWESSLATELSWSFVTPMAAPRVSIGYEFNSFWNMSEVYRPTQTTKTDLLSQKNTSYSNEPIYVHGLTLSVSVGF